MTQILAPVARLDQSAPRRSESALAPKSAPQSEREPARKLAFVQTQAENAGAQEVARQLAYGAARCGMSARQIFFFRRTEGFDGDPNVHFCASRRPRSALGVAKLLYDLYRELRREAPDVVFTFQHYGNLIGALAARLAGVRLIVASQVSAKEVIPPLARRLDRWLGMLGAYDHIVVNSAATAASFADYPASYRKRIVLIEHGFLDKSSGLDQRAARAALGLPQTSPLLGCAARLSPLKRLDLAIQILKINPEQHLALAGQGAERSALEALAQSLDVAPRLHFVGELDAAGMGVFLAALDGFVFPSAAESFGLAPVEAAQAGIPVLANDLPVLRDVLSVGGAPCAIFCDARDSVAFAAAARNLILDKALTSKTRAAGTKLKDRFPLEAMIEAYLKLADAGVG